MKKMVWWRSIEAQLPTGLDQDLLVWGKGWRHPRLASYDTEAGEFFDPESFASYFEISHWSPIPELKDRLDGWHPGGTLQKISG